MAAAPSISKAKIPEHNVESALLQARKQEKQPRPDLKELFQTKQLLQGETSAMLVTWHLI